MFFDIAVHWVSFLAILLLFAHFFNNITLFLFFRAPAHLAEDSAALIDLMKMKMKKKKKVEQPRAPTTLDTDLAAI